MYGKDLKVWAPPLAWGPWVNLHTHVGNSAYTVSFDAVSSLQSTFDAEIQYVTNSGDRTVRTMVAHIELMEIMGQDKTGLGLRAIQ
ncbi:colicin Z C-terminal domain-related protein [Providencia hangzhouensis]